MDMYCFCERPSIILYIVYLKRSTQYEAKTEIWGGHEERQGSEARHDNFYQPIPAFMAACTLVENSSWT